MDKDLAYFAVQKGERMSERLAEKCLREIAKLLQGRLIEIDNQTHKIENLHIQTNENGIMGLLFNIAMPSKNGEIDYLEFAVLKTGWGMRLV